MTNSMNTSTLIFNLNERLFINSLNGITEEQAHETISGHNNSIAWIAAHTVWARYNMLFFLGKPAKNPFEGMFENFKPFNANETYPSLETIKKEWANASALLKEALKNTSEEHLAAESPIKSPIGDFSNAGTLAFLAQHESYDIGQLGFLKKYYTTEAMQY
jgi:hypothetical protein